MDPLKQVVSELRVVQSAYYSAYAAAVTKPSNKLAVARLLDLYQDGSVGAQGMAKYVSAVEELRLRGTVRAEGLLLG